MTKELIAAAEYVDRQISEMKSDIKDIKKMMQEKSDAESLDEYVPLERAIKIMGVSRKKFYNLRVAGRINYYQDGHRITVSRRDIKIYMDKHYIKSINY